MRNTAPAFVNTQKKKTEQKFETLVEQVLRGDNSLPINYS